MQARPILPCTSTSGRLINKMALALSLSTVSVMLREEGYPAMQGNEGVQGAVLNPV